MSIAAAQSSQFVPQAQAAQSVFTFTSSGGDYLVFRVRDFDTIPFWSTRSRLERICQLHPKYRTYVKVELSLERFLAWLPQLAADRMHIGINWSGKRLTGYNVPATDLLARFNTPQRQPTV